MRRTVALLSLLAGCATTSAPASQPEAPATPLVEAAPEIDDAPVRAVIEPFLAARWAYDADGIYDYISREDQAKPWKTAMTSTGEYIRGGPGAENWGDVQFEVLGIEMRPDSAIVHVDVTSASLASRAMLMQRSALHMIKFQRWLVKDMQARAGTLPWADFMPDREVVTHSYRVEKIDAEWKVVMGWPEAQRILEISDQAERDAALQSFVGSEKKSLLDAVSHRYQPKPDDATAALVKAIQDAESMRHDGGFLEAIAAYDALIADSPALPEFVLERRAELERLSDAQTAHLAAAKLRIGKVKVEKKGEKRMVTVEVTNDGPDLQNATIAFPAPSKQRPNKKYTQFTQALKRGETKVVTLRHYDLESGVPDAPTLVDVRYRDKTLQAAHPREEDPEFQRKREDLQTGGRSRGRVTRSASRVLEQLEAADACRGDDEEPLDVLVAVDEAGRATATADRAEQYVRCLQNVVDKIEFDVTGESRRVVVRLLPPTHWSRE